MELTPGVILVAAVAMAVIFVLIRWTRRHEAAPPVDGPVAHGRSHSLMATGNQRDGHPLVDWLLDRAFEQTGIRVADDPLARQRIAEAAAKAMDELQAGGSATISLPFLTADAQGPKHFNVQIKRNPDSTFEQQR